MMRPILALALLLPVQAVHAVTINYGNEFSVSGNYVDSLGQPLTAAGFQFELGYFTNNGPRGTRSTWRDQWVTLSMTDFNEDDSFFSGTWTDDSGALTGEELYVWINNGDFSASESSEWALVSSDDWIVPAEDGQETEVRNFLIAESASQADTLLADRVLVGAFDDLEGEGRNQVDRPEGTFLQTYIVPEPSSLLLVGIGSLGLLRRKRG